MKTCRQRQSALDRGFQGGKVRMGPRSGLTRAVSALVALAVVGGLETVRLSAAAAATNGKIAFVRQGPCSL